MSTYHLDFGSLEQVAVSNFSLNMCYVGLLSFSFFNSMLPLLSKNKCLLLCSISPEQLFTVFS